MLRAQRRDPAKAQAKCAFATNYPLANRQLRSPLILRYRMQRDKPSVRFGPLEPGRALRGCRGSWSCLGFSRIQAPPSSAFGPRRGLHAEALHHLPASGFATPTTLGFVRRCPWLSPAPPLRWRWDDHSWCVPEVRVIDPRALWRQALRPAFRPGLPHHVRAFHQGVEVSCHAICLRQNTMARKSRSVRCPRFPRALPKTVGSRGGAMRAARYGSSTG